MHADVQMHVCLEWCLETCVFKMLLDILLTHSHLRTTMKYLIFHLGLHELYLVSNLVFFGEVMVTFLQWIPKIFKFTIQLALSPCPLYTCQITSNSK